MLSYTCQHTSHGHATVYLITTLIWIVQLPMWLIVLQLWLIVECTKLIMVVFETSGKSSAGTICH